MKRILWTLAAVVLLGEAAQPADACGGCGFRRVVRVCPSVTECTTKCDRDVDPGDVTPVTESTPAPKSEATKLEPTPAVPTDAKELHAFIAGRLGGYCRPDHGVTVDVYQARGKQRVVWEVVEDPKDWLNAISKALYGKVIMKANEAGLVIGPGEGADLNLVEQVCRAAGVWLVTMDESGALNRRIYGNK